MVDCVNDMPKSKALGQMSGRSIRCRLRVVYMPASYQAETVGPTNPFTRATAIVARVKNLD